MSETIQSISQGTFTIGQTSATNLIAGPGIKIDEPSAGTVRIGGLLPQTLEFTANVTASKASGINNWVCCTLSATVPEGYEFGCWCNIATRGWGGACYAEFPLSQVTNCWNPCRSDAITTAAGIRAAYIVIPSGGNE